MSVHDDLPLVPFPRVRVMEHSPEFLAHIEKAPVFRARTRTDRVVWVVSGYDEVRGILTDSRFIAPGAVPGIEEYGLFPALPRDNLIALDGAEHLRLRGAVTPAFSPRRIAALRLRVQAIVDGLLDELVAAGPPADLHPVVSWPMPILVICELLGVPFEERDEFTHWADRAMSGHGDVTTVRHAYGQLHTYILRIAERKRALPGEDVLTTLNGAVDAGTITHDDVGKLAAQLLMAGHNTTVTHIEYSIIALLRDDEQRQRLIDDPGLAVTAVDELLRLFPAGIGDIGTLRYTVQDAEVGDTTIPAGSLVVACLPGANLDPARFADPCRLDIGRTANPHLTFAYGPHHCVGAALVRLELEVLFTELFTRMPGLRLSIPDDDLRLRTDIVVGGVLELPVEW